LEICHSEEAPRPVGELGQDPEIDPPFLITSRNFGVQDSSAWQGPARIMICWVDRETIFSVANLLTGYSLLAL
jgi:hypothetical protein